MKYQVGDIVKVVVDYPSGLFSEDMPSVRGQCGAVVKLFSDGAPDVRLFVSGDTWAFEVDDIEPYIGIGGTPRLQPGLGAVCRDATPPPPPEQPTEEMDAAVADIDLGSLPLVHCMPPRPAKARPRFSTIPHGVLWDIAQVLTDGLTAGDDPTKLRGLYGWRDMQNQDPGGTEMTYFDSLMRHIRDGEWVKVAVNAIILADLANQEER